MIVASGLLSRWFTTRIGSIMSLPYAAVGAGMLILPPLTQLLLSTYDWRITHRILGTGVLLALPLVMLLPLGPHDRRARPIGARCGLEPPAPRRGDGRSPPLCAPVPSGDCLPPISSRPIAAYSVLPHSVAYLVEQGFNPLIAAGAFGMTGMLSVVGILASAGCPINSAGCPP
jgi:hypothetical protein